MFLVIEGVKYGNAQFEGVRRTKFVLKRTLALSERVRGRLSGNARAVGAWKLHVTEG